MISLFDYFEKYDLPTFVLCNPNGDQLYALGDISDRTLTLRFNALSEINFVAKSKITTMVDGVDVIIDTPYFDLLDYLRLIYVPNIGYFMITGKEEDTEGFAYTKTITAQSLEVDFSFKRLTLFKGTYKFYDVINPTGTLIRELLNYAPDWSVGQIDASLMALYRTFDVSDSNIYSFLMNDVSTAFQCVFTFDTINKTISAHTVSTATTQTDIYLSYDNLVEKTNIKQITEEMVTALTVYGGGDLDIRTVNPLGTDTIYNFEYYETLEWMDASLIAALDLWEANIVANQPAYSALLVSLKNNYTLLYVKDAELTDLNNELTTLETLLKAAIQLGEPTSTINGQVLAKKAEIAAKQAEIDAVNAVITGLIAQLKVINTALSFETNFTQQQIVDISHFIRGNTYNNENFIQTDSMTSSEVQTMAQELYDQALSVLAKVSQPRYEFSLDAANFIFLKEFQTFIDQLVLGAVVTVEISDSVHTYPVLLELEIDYDDPTNFGMTFGNRLRLDNNAFQFSDLFNGSVDSGIKTSFNSRQWGNFEDNYKNDVSTFLTSALDTSKNAVINATNQEITITENGLRGQYLDPETGLYSPKKVWLIGNMLAFTRDNWDTASLALGEIIGPDGNATYGLVAETIVGNLVASNELMITNANNTFVVNGSGATLTNATFTLTTEDLLNQITLNPIDGIAIKKKDPISGLYTNQFYVDAQGNVVFSGSLSAATGSFAGEISARIGNIGAWTIDDLGLRDNNGNYIYGNGKIRLGALSIDGSSGYFSGNFDAPNLRGLLQSNQIGSVNASTINAGVINGIRVHGSTITWGGTLASPLNTMGVTTNNFSQILSKRGITLKLDDGAGIYLVKNDILFLSGGQNHTPISIGTGFEEIDIAGQLYVSKPGIPRTTAITKTVPAGSTSPMTFVNGLLVNSIGDAVEITPSDGLNFGFSVTFGDGFTGRATPGAYAYIRMPYDCLLTQLTILVDSVAEYAYATLDKVPYDTFPMGAGTFLFVSSQVWITNQLKNTITANVEFVKGDMIQVCLQYNGTSTDYSKIVTISGSGVKQ